MERKINYPVFSFYLRPSPKPEAKMLTARIPSSSSNAISFKSLAILSGGVKSSPVFRAQVRTYRRPSSPSISSSTVVSNARAIFTALAVKCGVLGAEKGEEVAPIIVILSPDRMFREIDQSESLFFLRGGESVRTCALLKADGGCWRNEAMLMISSWIKKTSRVSR